MKYILCFIALFIQSNWCSAATPIGAEALENQAKKFLQGYVDHLNLYLSGEDLQAVHNKTSQDIRIPSQVIQDNGVLLTYNDSDQVIKGFTGFLEQIKSVGVQRIQWQQMDIKALNDYAVLAENSAVLLDAAGKTIKTIKGIYVLHRSNENWATVLRIPQTY